MVFNAVNGNAGAIGMAMGGYDYHNNPRATTDARDNALGTLVGRCLQSLALLGKRGTIMVTTDGSVSSAQSDQMGSPFVSDRGVGGSYWAIFYDPVKQLMVSNQQIGWLNNGQASEGPAANPEKAAAAIVLNYMTANGISVGRFQTDISASLFPNSSVLDSLVRVT